VPVRFHRRHRLQGWVHVAGLAATAWLVLPRGGPNLFQRLLQGWIVGCLALAWAIGMVLLLRLVVRHVSRVDVMPAHLRGASPGVWFAPAILLPFTPAGITASVVLVIGATRLLCSTSETADGSGCGDVKVLRAGELSMEALPRHIVPAFAVSAGLQGTVCLTLIGHSATAAGLLSMSVATLTSLAIAAGAWAENRPPHMPRSVFGLCLTFLLALMVGHCMGGAGSAFGAGSAGSSLFGPEPAGNPRDPIAAIDPHKPKAPELPPTPPPGATGEVTPNVNVSDSNIAGSFPGVILWPEVKPDVALVMPYPVMRGTGPPALVRPFVIPFGGEYWMFRWPFARPPRYSYFRRGSPAKLAFSTTDRTALHMEALQKLDRTIDLACCSTIEVSVENADRAAAGISLELIVIDADPPYKPPLSLGTVPLRSVMKASSPMLETLDFRVPAAPRLTQFDEFKVVFHRDPGHQDHSSRVAIERFTLIP
jgi:hypothetical protein